MVTNKKNLKKLVAKMTDVMPRRLHVQPVKETDPEYYGLVDVLDDDMVELALAMKQRKPTFPEDLVKKLGFVHCGTIYVEEDNYPRMAYEKII